MSDNLALSDIMLFIEGMIEKSVPDAENHAPNDLLNAAHAIAMVTANIDHFTGLRNLVVENWLA
jgi:predicted nucleic acid-binding protein